MLKIISEGGIVMWPLIICSITSLACIIERILYWRKIYWHHRFSINSSINKNKETNEIHINYLKKNISFPLANVLLMTLTKEYSDNNQFDLILATSIRRVIPDIRKFNSVFSTIISVSPLLGLLGTILGLINSFEFIAIGKGGFNAEQVTGGISEALISTATGLIIAIFTLVFANYFKSLANKEISLIHNCVLEYKIGKRS
tara:strand:+ start:780 stop:1382 length:603 start_codon:yes stop_codon:yes gene_type:complete